MGLGIFLKLTAAFSPKWSIPRLSHCLEVLLSPLELISYCRSPSTVFPKERGEPVSVRLLLLTSQKGEAHLCVCSPWGREGRAGEGAAAGSLQGQAVSTAFPVPAGPGWPRPGSAWCLLPTCCLSPSGSTPLCSFRLMQSALHQAISNGK